MNVVRKSCISINCRSELPGPAGMTRQPTFLRAVVGDQRAGEHAVGHHVLEHILLRDAGHDERACAQFGGVVHVLAREEERLGFAGGAAGGVQAESGIVRHGQQAGGIIRAQVGIAGKGQAAQVGERPDILRHHAQFGEFLPVERHVRNHAPDGFLQTFKLQPLQRRAIERFNFLIPKHD
jgi:hypothetical protein